MTSRPPTPRGAPRRLLPTALGLLALLGSLLVAGTVPTATANARGETAARTAVEAGRAIVGFRVFGKTVRGRELKAFRLGQPGAARKAVFVGAMHGDETGPSRILVNLMQGAPIRGVDLWVIPYLNKDGVARGTRKNARGVDLNRNFPVRWIRQYGRYDSGPRPASEPETRSLMRFLRNVDPRWVISMHQPLYGVDNSYNKTRNFAPLLARELELPLKVFSCRGGCHGTMTQWFNRRRPGMALTLEYGSSMTRRQLNLSPGGLLRSIGGRR